MVVKSIQEYCCSDRQALPAECVITDHCCEGHELFRLPCGHYMCEAGLRQMRRNECPMRCPVALDFSQILMQNGKKPLPPSTSMPVCTQQRRRRTRGPEDDMTNLKREVPTGSRLPGFATEEICADPDCPKSRELTHNTMWNQSEGKFDLGETTSFSGCHCGERRVVRKLFFTDCHVSIQGLEIFVGGFKQPFEWHGHTGIGKTLMFPTEGIYMDLRVATRPGMIPAASVPDVPSRMADPSMHGFATGGFDIRAGMNSVSSVPEPAHHRAGHGAAFSLHGQPGEASRFPQARSRIHGLSGHGAQPTRYH